MKRKKENSLRWLLEPLEDGPGYLERPMFGCLAAYLSGRLMAVVADREPPWSGLLVPTEREHHASLQREFPALRPHPVLGKWLYVPAEDEDFEETAQALTGAMLAGDGRLGVEPSKKVSKGRKNAKTSRKRLS